MIGVRTGGNEMPEEHGGCVNNSAGTRARTGLMKWGRPGSIALRVPLVVILSWLAAALKAAPPKSRDNTASVNAPIFEKDILPIFKTNCLRCHDSTIKKGGLDLSTPEGVLAGGSAGPVVVPNEADASRLYEMVHNGMMPLDRKTQVSAAE